MRLQRFKWIYIHESLRRNRGLLQRTFVLGQRLVQELKIAGQLEGMISMATVTELGPIATFQSFILARLKLASTSDLKSIMAPIDTRNKRKTPSSSSQSSRKKAKTQHRTADALPWKTVSRPVDAGLDGDDGILELEEVDDVEVVYEETEAGRVVKFNVRIP